MERSHLFLDLTATDAPTPTPARCLVCGEPLRAFHLVAANGTTVHVRCLEQALATAEPEAAAAGDTK
jgi:hypothetical protein